MWSHHGSISNQAKQSLSKSTAIYPKSNAIPLDFGFHFAGQKCLAWKSALGLLIESCDSILPTVEQLLEGGGRQEGVSDGVGFLVARTSQRFSGGRGHQNSKFPYWFVYQFDCVGTSTSGLQTVNGESMSRSGCRWRIDKQDPRSDPRWY